MRNLEFLGLAIALFANTSACSLLVDPPEVGSAVDGGGADEAGEGAGGSSGASGRNTGGGAATNATNAGGSSGSAGSDNGSRSDGGSSGASGSNTGGSGGGAAGSDSVAGGSSDAGSRGASESNTGGSGGGAAGSDGVAGGSSGSGGGSDGGTGGKPNTDECPPGWTGENCETCVVYVNGAVAENGDGQTWTSAFQSVTAGLDAAEARLSAEVSTCQLWVAAGRYIPGQATTSSFQLREHIDVYGGFVGTEDSLQQRSWEDNETILSGDVNNNDVGAFDTNRTDNVFHVVLGADNARLDGFTISGGHAAGDEPEAQSGGGAYFNSVSPTVEHCIFTDNYAIEYGGAVYNELGANPLFRDCNFLANEANAGGGVANWNSSPTIAGCEFELNSSDAGSLVSNRGGGMFNWKASPIVEDTLFLRNRAQNGGGMFNDSSSSPTVSRCQFVDNTAAQGGGVYSRENSSLRVSDSGFTRNIATIYGGGMFSMATSIILVNVLFQNNTAEAEDGGGAWLSNSSATIDGCIFDQNTAKIRGGGLYLTQSLPTTVSDTLFLANSAEFGGAVCTVEASPLFVNATIVGNTGTTSGGFGGGFGGEGGGVFHGTLAVSGENAIYRNSIFWGNTPDQNFDAEGLLTVFENSLVQGGVAGTNIITADPLFIDADNGDYRLSPGSPAIDTGSNTHLPPDTNDLDNDSDVTEVIPFDLDGDARIVGGTVDIGAYEAQGL